ncbi:MAG TPA: tRNA preQ1(34) S-adenosylmethionine ribosyltransferase-isomerase QueA [Acidimicrobiales bacterium]|nr:tRNA preQ1(34) S-adenosylmethionine ribosyltransferase-isomerase QueA [Acidimicrobiales bacterium]
MVALAEFDYPLPPEAIAQVPAEPRESARLLVDLGAGVSHRRVSDLPDLVGPGDVLVVNETRVRPARLLLRKATGGQVEVLLLEPAGDGWRALVRPGRRAPAGTLLAAEEGGPPLVEVGGDAGDGTRTVRLLDDVDPHAALALPPYITAGLADPERYQTVYARTPGSVAAPTAGLHLSHAVLDACRERGAEVHAVDLAVGLGTFRPMKAGVVEDHVMHGEHYTVPAGTMEACRRAGRVVAVGTTTVRALESAAATGRLTGRTELFIHGDYPFRAVDVLLTNFHQPRSSLLVLLAAFAGPRWRGLYEVALAEGYRFLSFGDAMLVSIRPGSSRGAPVRREGGR